MRPRPDPAILEAAWTAIRARLEAGKEGGLLVAGICGAQGSGKSTLARAIARRAGDEGITVAVLSLDDLHPLLSTRGPPGTHDVALGLAAIAALERGEPACLPRFDKGRDDRAHASQWDRAPANTRLLVLEGWCLSAVPQDEAALPRPVNPLEREEDPQGLWRNFVNRALAGDYARLFARLDLLILLAAPSFDVVRRWRGEQEEALRQADAPEAMDEAAIDRFVQHYERLTRHVLAEMPARADLVARLNEDRSARWIELH
jgi:D-glycerate 3-kinase